MELFQIFKTVVIFFMYEGVGGWGVGGVLRGLGVRVVRGSQFYNEKSVLLGFRDMFPKKPS